MDRVYKGDIPRHKKTLLELRRAFAGVAAGTDWAKLRIEPLLGHVTQLERLLRSPRFARETQRLRRGVSLFHSDLVYLRTNIKILKEILAGESRISDGKKQVGRQMRPSPKRSKPESRRR